jgi:hypothetical protein
MKVFDDPRDYFPYIGHDLDLDFMKKTLNYRVLIGDLFEKQNISEPDIDTLIIDGPGKHSVFRRVEIKGIRVQRELAKNNSCSQLLTPRHRSLFDYCVGQPVHNHFINPHVLIIAGNNLFVSGFNAFLRKYGGVVFLRSDDVLKRKGLPNAFLTQKKYIDEVFPAYMKQQMFDGDGSAKIKMDVILYPEQEKDPVTKKRSGGRTKTGKLRSLSHIFFDKLKSLTKESEVSLYVTPVSISFSKYPDAPYIVHPAASKGLMKGIRYILEQSFTIVNYPKYAIAHEEAKLEATIRYGKPEILKSSDFSSTRDLIRYSHTLKEKIGMLETIYPLVLLFHAMEADTDLPLLTLGDRAKKLHHRYSELGIDTGMVSDNRGNMTGIEELVEKAVRTINSNPNLYITGVNEHRFLSCKSGRLISLDPNLQAWYANHLRHLDHDEGLPGDDFV